MNGRNSSKKSSACISLNLFCSAVALTRITVGAKLQMSYRYVDTCRTGSIYDFLPPTSASLCPQMPVEVVFIVDLNDNKPGVKKSYKMWNSSKQMTFNCTQRCAHLPATVRSVHIRAYFVSHSCCLDSNSFLK